MMGGFFRELKRRRVLHTAALYVAGAWIALQVVEVLAGAGLPPASMRLLLVALSGGFPVVLVVGWYFAITVNGITRTGNALSKSHVAQQQTRGKALIAVVAATGRSRRIDVFSAH